jgi:hypothetical protein
MKPYLLSVHTHRDGSCPSELPGEDMQALMERIQALEADMKRAGALVCTGRLAPPDDATVVRDSSGEVLRTDGPFADTKEQLGGFYVLRAADLEAALEWAGRVTACIGQPIEVRAFNGFEAG